MSSKKHKVGSIYARVTRLDGTYYRVDFTRNENLYDSDDEGDDWQWSYPIRFSVDLLRGQHVFLNTDEIPYDTRERYTARCFWRTDSTSIPRLVCDTWAVRRARGESLPTWSLSAICKAADVAWDDRMG